MKNVIYALYALVFVLLASSACAAASFTVTDLDFGSDGQVRGEDITQTMTITNDGTEALTIDLASKLPTVYNVGLSQSSVTLAAGESKDIDVTITVPDTASSKKTEIKSGILATSSVSGLTKTSKVYLTAESNLEITKVSVFIDDGSEKTLKEDDSYDSGVKAGSSLVIRVYVKNTYSDDEDIDINDIEVSVESDDDLDLDDSESMDDLNAGDKDYVEFSAEIPSDADDGDDYDIDVDVEGQDDNDAWHYDSYSTNIEVSKESHDVQIERAKLSPSTVTCGGKVTVSADLYNAGKDDEDRVFLLIENDDLNIMEKLYSLELDEDDTATETYSFNVNNKTAPGSYDIMLTSFYGSDKQSDAQVLTLNVESCQSTTTTTNTNTGTTTTTTPVVIPQVVPVSGSTPVYGSASFTDSPAYLIVLVAAVVIILAILIILLVKFVF